MSVVQENKAPQDQPLVLIYNRFQLKQNIRLNYTFHPHLHFTRPFNNCLLETEKEPEEAQNFFGIYTDDSSGESSNSSLHGFNYFGRPNRALNIESHHQVKSNETVNIASQLEINSGPLSLPVIGVVAPTDPRIRPANHIPDKFNVITAELKERTLRYRL